MNLYRACTVEGCNRPHDSRGMCGMHVKRWLRTGTTDPRPVGRPAKPIVHGTYAGSFPRMRRNGELCPPCREARAAYKRARRAMRSAARRQLQEAA